MAAKSNTKYTFKITECILSRNLIKKYFENMKGGTLIFFCPVWAPAKGGKSAYKYDILV
jgi:hypothetical protein